MRHAHADVHVDPDTNVYAHRDFHTLATADFHFYTVGDPNRYVLVHAHGDGQPHRDFHGNAVAYTYIHGDLHAHS